MSELREDGLLWGDYHLPYYPPLVKYARQMRNQMTPEELRLWASTSVEARPRILRQRPIGFLYCRLFLL